jgi:aldehyde:ferredoxin oxidoreductase
MNNIPQVISLATGLEMDKEKLWKAFQRIRTLVRAVNVRRGLRRKDERPPEDHWAVRDEKYEQELLSKYYEFKGWNSEGIPIRQRLEGLDLAYVADDLEQRGILTVDEDVSAGKPSAEAAVS